MRDLLRFYFSMNRRERRGVLFLLFSLLILMMGYIPLRHFLERGSMCLSVQYPEPESEITVLEWQKNTYRNNLKPRQNRSYFQKKKFTKKPFLSSEKSGHGDSVRKKYTAKKFPEQTFDLNTIDSSALTSIPGIGPALSSRIIKYRKKLGGFYDAGQLYEVWGLDSSLVKLLIPHCVTGGNTKMDLNKVSFDELKQHPYISFNIARLIVNYRKSHGLYKSVGDLQKLDLVDADLYAKLAPYFKVQE